MVPVPGIVIAAVEERGSAILNGMNIKVGKRAADCLSVYRAPRCPTEFPRTPELFERAPADLNRQGDVCEPARVLPFRRQNSAAYSRLPN